jgi:hypothetical protein
MKEFIRFSGGEKAAWAMVLKVLHPPCSPQQPRSPACPINPLGRYTAIILASGRPNALHHGVFLAILPVMFFLGPRSFHLSREKSRTSSAFNTPSWCPWLPLRSSPFMAFMATRAHTRLSVLFAQGAAVNYADALKKTERPPEETYYH